MFHKEVTNKNLKLKDHLKQCEDKRKLLKLVLTQLGYEIANWIKLAESRVNWRDFMNVVMEVQVS
jgi:maltooligosyltrehalose synthase